jgi:hypothetical protein
MHIEDFEKILRRRPFRPFRITVTTQQTFDVSHPEMVFTRPRFVAVGVLPHDESPEAGLVMHWIDVQHIVHVHPILS